MAEIIFQFLGSVTYWPGDSPGQGEKGKESTRKDSGSGSVECTGSSKEGRVALKICPCTADRILLLHAQELNNSEKP